MISDEEYGDETWQGALALTLALLAAPAVADVWQYGQSECNGLWFMRNLIMDRAGYCCDSALGQALYDNGNCRGKDVSLTPARSRQVQKIQTLERQIGCKVDSGQRRLDRPTMDWLRRLRDMPLPDNGGSACLNRSGGAVPLRDGYATGSQVIGRIERGDHVHFGYIGEGDWSVVSDSKGGNDGRSMTGWHEYRSVDTQASGSDWAG